GSATQPRRAPSARGAISTPLACPPRRGRSAAGLPPSACWSTCAATRRYATAASLSCSSMRSATPSSPATCPSLPSARSPTPLLPDPHPFQPGTAMPLSPPAPREHLHTRNIECTGYLRTDGMWEVDAHLTDTKTYDFQSSERGDMPAGRHVHDMWIRL